MIIEPDDFNIGDFIVPVEDLENTRAAEASPVYVAKPMFGGFPMQIKAINLPYVAVKVGKDNSVVDVRRFNFIRASQEYVDVVWSFEEEDQNKNNLVDFEGDPEGFNGSEESCCPDDVIPCPLCGKQLFTRTNDNGIIEGICESCGPDDINEAINQREK